MSVLSAPTANALVNNTATSAMAGWSWNLENADKTKKKIC